MTTPFSIDRSFLLHYEFFLGNRLWQLSSFTARFRSLVAAGTTFVNRVQVSAFRRHPSVVDRARRCSEYTLVHCRGLSFPIVAKLDISSLE
jgi:hypothetical protein